MDTPASGFIAVLWGRVNRASASKTVDSGSIPGRVKPKTRKIGIRSFPAGSSALKGTVFQFLD